MSVTSQSGTNRLVNIRGWIVTVKQQLDRPLTAYYLLLATTGMLLTIGLIMVLSASSVYSYRNYDHNSYYVFFKQLSWVVIGLPVALLASRFPQRWLRWLAWPAVGVSVVLLILVQTSLGVTINGNRNWLRLGPIQIQPSEVAKFAIVLWAATVLSKKEKLLSKAIHIVVPVVPVVVMIAALVVVGHDLGTALVLFAILLGVLWVAGLPMRWFAITFLIIGTTAFGLAATSTERRERLTTFLNPFQDFRGKGWQAGNGLLGMSNGGVFGRGISASQQKWGNLPEAHTDFIFAVIGEELGLVGTLLVLVLFAALCFAMVRLAMDTSDPFVRYATAGITIWLMAQMMINIGMVLALLPVVGIPLPLVSYGGSGLVPTLMALGLLIGFARNEPAAKAALSDRRRGRTKAPSADSVSAVARLRGRFGR